VGEDRVGDPPQESQEFSWQQSLTLDWDMGEAYGTSCDEDFLSYGQPDSLDYQVLDSCQPESCDSTDADPPGISHHRPGLVQEPTDYLASTQNAHVHDTAEGTQETVPSSMTLTLTIIHLLHCHPDPLITRPSQLLPPVRT